ncbi:hypothetical protein GCM10011403_12560 [Pseudohongiella nitratireducens]|uniref:DUF2797 domain-containing protein n=1 Tax=Pseudohongiella nitratireducens TaxID=1768907 RepID=A0A917GTU2_9GAMM|nr:DUF2797 domain-containing protein [Pseudohongiella nitratireducens]MDF1624387.1 DUF2797 domain-containing protein [Pseudohongiella nitratireducens]GGG56883.1 hypothetical protein GCM10011403_12560 [Pseudohongiella nitratireducens]|tara:strand:+ start:3216 stop:4049 length:834 start_codon:yes stop_codon:yes gene_type:complete
MLETLATGVARKMRSRLTAPVSYEMPLGESSVGMNELIGGTVRLRYLGRIFCVHCGRASNKSFNQGYCYPCFQSLAQCDSCIIHPERCHFDQGTCREPAWGEAFCMQDHIVYLANSSGLKVGITRSTQIPTRWIDQGAIQALAIARVRSRLQSGVLEVMFKKFVNDKTNWRDMLREGDQPVDLIYERNTLLENSAEDLKEMTEQYGFHALSLIKGIEPTDITYPVHGYPEKISSFNFDKDPVVEGTLLGIKGQYLMFDTGVINIRRFGGYELELARD